MLAHVDCLLENPEKYLFTCVNIKYTMTAAASGWCKQLFEPYRPYLPLKNVKHTLNTRMYFNKMGAMVIPFQTNI